MSRPTYATFYNADDEEIVNQFVNVGQAITHDNFVDAIKQLPWVRDAEYLVLYNKRIEKQHLKPNRGNVNQMNQWEHNLRKAIGAPLVPNSNVN